MSIYYIRPITRKGLLEYVVYDHAGQPISRHLTRIEALTAVHICMNSEAVICIGTLRNIFSASDSTPEERRKCPTTEPNRLP